MSLLGQPIASQPFLRGLFHGLADLKGWGDLFQIAAPDNLSTPLKRRMK